MSRIGKIARLPRVLRDELNRRLERNTPGRTLAAWLNGLPEVAELLRDSFEGKPINEQNLSDWRQGGFAEWQTRNDLLDRIGDASDTADDLDHIAPLMADRAARILSSRFLVILAEWNGDPDDPAFTSLKHYSKLVRDIATLRRGELSAARVKMEQQAFDLACRDRETSDGQNGRPVPFPPFQRGARRVGLPGLLPPPPKPDPVTEEALAALRELIDGYRKTWMSTQPSEAGDPPGESTGIKQNQPTNSRPQKEPLPVPPPQPASPSGGAPQNPAPAASAPSPAHPAPPLPNTTPGHPAMGTGHLHTSLTDADLRQPPCRVPADPPPVLRAIKACW